MNRKEFIEYIKALPITAGIQVDTYRRWPGTAFSPVRCIGILQNVKIIKYPNDYTNYLSTLYNKR